MYLEAQWKRRPISFANTTLSIRYTQSNIKKKRNRFGRLIEGRWVTLVNPLTTYPDTENENNFEKYSDDDEEA